MKKAFFTFFVRVVSAFSLISTVFMAGCSFFQGEDTFDEKNDISFTSVFYDEYNSQQVIVASGFCSNTNAGGYNYLYGDSSLTSRLGNGSGGAVYVDEGPFVIIIVGELPLTVYWDGGMKIHDSGLFEASSGQKRERIVKSYTLTLDSVNAVGPIDKKFWGTWTEMSTGKQYHMDSYTILARKAYSKSYSYTNPWKVYTTSVDGWTFDGDNVLTDGTYYFFRSGGKARSFKLSVSGFSDSVAAYSARAISIGQQGVRGRRQNQMNSADSENVTSDENGVLSFTDAVAEDAQKITVEGCGSITATPQYDGENIGTIPLVESGKYAFKTTYTLEEGVAGIHYANKTYDLALTFTNVGEVTCKTSYYEISSEDSNVKYVSTTGNFSSISSGGSRKIETDVRYDGEIDGEYIDVPITIAITDSETWQTWNDSITLRFYKKSVPVYISARTIDYYSGDLTTLNGFFIYPDGRSQRFAVRTGSSATVNIPWSEDDFTLVFSGATSAANEIKYAFGFTSVGDLPSLAGDFSISELRAYEPNNTTSAATRISDLSQPVKGYLTLDDVDFFTFNVKDL